MSKLPDLPTFSETLTPIASDAQSVVSRGKASRLFAKFLRPRSSAEFLLPGETSLESTSMASWQAPEPALELTPGIPPLFSVPQASPVHQKLWWSSVLISLGLHGAMLCLPLPPETPTPTPKVNTQKQVRVTQLPIAKPSLTTPAKATPAKVSTPSPKAVVPANPTLVVPPATPKPKPTPPPTEEKPKAEKPPEKTLEKPKLEKPKPEETKPEEIKPQTTASTPTATPSPPATPVPEALNPDDAWRNFPLYPGSKPGCFNLSSCLQAEDSLSQVSSHFAQALPAQNYEIKVVTQDAQHVIYQVLKAGRTQFLSVLVAEKETVYVLADAPRSLEELKQAVEVPPEVADILRNLDAQAAEAALFTNASLFYTTNPGIGGPPATVPHPEILSLSFLAGQSAQTMMDEYFRSNLQNNGYEVRDLNQQYGGGLLYQVQKDSLTLYLNLVPTQDGTGTLVVMWKKLP